jgi:hypothetical protein
MADVLRARTERTGEKIVLTRRVVQKEKLTSTPAVLYSELQATVLKSWTILHVHGEDLSAIEERAKKNERVWASAIANYTERKPMTFNASGMDISTANNVISRICGVKLEYRSLLHSSLSVSMATGIPAQDFCRDYTLILAANGIVIRQEGERLIAEVEDAGGDDRRRKT